MSTRRSVAVFNKVVGQQQVRYATYHVSPFGTKFGPGGRSSDSGITATVFGAYGSVGRYVVDELGKCGSRVYVPFRGCEMEVRHLKPSFDLGQLGLMPFSPRDRESIYEAVKKSDVVINLIGKHYETKHLVPTRRPDGSLSRVNYDFEEVHATIPRVIAEVAKEAGVPAFIHVSSLSADPNSKSKWSRTKAAGEAAVREVYPDSVIVRPATIFGPEDRFLNWIAETMARAPYFPLLNGGSTLVQPVYAVDVGKAIFRIIEGYNAFAGRTFELTGPAEYTYKEVAEFVGEVTSLRKPLIDVPVPLAEFLGKYSEHMINPVLTKDMIAQLQENVLPRVDQQYLGLADLNIEPASMDRVAFDFLHRFRPGGHFVLVEGYH